MYHKCGYNNGKKYTIDPAREVDNIIDWIKEKFADYGKYTTAVIGMSGGKDSTIAAALLREAIGPERVFGIIMPDGDGVKTNDDKNLAITICQKLKIQYTVINIGDITKSFYDTFYDEWSNAITDGVKTNTPARIRMSMLYAIGSTIHGRVVNTCNSSEEYLGWSTKYGDAAGDFALFTEYPVRYVKMLGYELAERGIIDIQWVDRIPDDGMCGFSDEDKFGFSYDELDDYLINGVTPDIDKLTKMREMYQHSYHKRKCLNLDAPHISTEHEEGTVWVPEADPWF